MQRALDRLVGWPGLPHSFVAVTNYQIDQSLDAADAQLNSLVATAVPGSPARWVPDLIGVLHLFVTSAIPTYTFSDTLNAWGDLLNRVVPPFTIAPGAGTFGIITPYKIMGAAVAGTATALTDMLNGTYDPAQIEIDVIKTTTGATVTRADLTDSTSLETKIAASVALGGGVYSSPAEAFNQTLPTWTAAQVNPFTVVTYVVLVGLYKRFQETAALQTFTVGTQYNSGTPYTIDLGSASTRSEYANGSFSAVDENGNAVSFQPADGNTYTSAWGALVTINTYGGGYTYTATLPGTAYFHAGAAGQSDTVQIPVTTVDGAPYTLTFQIKIVSTVNSAPTASPSNSGADALGVVRGTVGGSDADGDTLTYSLVNSSVNSVIGNSAYTKNGSGNGGVVTLDQSTGAFTYVSTSTAGTSQNFQVQLSDGHGGNTITTVTVPNTTSITPANVNTSTVNVVTGSVPAPANDAGMFTYSLGAAPAKGTVTSFDPATGTFTYTRNSSLGHTTSAGDVVTVIATDVNGRTVSLDLAVTPTIANNAPSATLTTAPTVGTLSGTVQTSTGKITASDADGDTLTYSASGLASGASVSFGSDGSFTYTADIPTATRHAAAKVGAAASAKNQTFTVTVSDGFGGSTGVLVTVPIYAVNSAPTISGGTTASFFGLSPTVTSIAVYDADGDNSGGSAYSGGAGYTITSGFNFVYLGNQQSLGTSSINAQSATTNYSGKTVTLTVYDGYYNVVNGVVQATLSNATKSWTF
ncbi:Ig-like domain-containing protein [Mycolicibacterium aromaticivorans]|uniref:Ig-like domain-containing protein n=1 Tax=Mycolicibacterium aromaticivorans TaxID=318425 RepID=UPI0004B46263|nr:Ig-like domain-containing protein [Mycolicibacterium aromaticivorans]